MNLQNFTWQRVLVVIRKIQRVVAAKIMTSICNELLLRSQLPFSCISGKKCTFGHEKKLPGHIVVHAPVHGLL
jgi:hypothetical protein